MRRSKLVEQSFALLLGLIPLCVFSQENIPIGSWRLHPSYNIVRHVAIEGDKRVYAAATHGIMILNRSDYSLESVTKLNGLNGTAVTDIGYDDQSQGVLISYEEGKFDLLDRDNHITTFDPVASSKLTGPRTINDIFVHEGLAYLASDYGVVVFDISRRQIKETWRDLGPSGETLKITASTIAADTIFLATAQGVLAANLTRNLQDFNNWKRFNAAPFDQSVAGLATFQGSVYAAINDHGVIRRENGKWILQSFLQGESFISMQGSAHSLMVTTTTSVFHLSETYDVTQVADPLITKPLFALADDAGKFWIGDGSNGLISNATGSFAAFLPDGPANNEIVKLRSYEGKIFALAGGYNADRTPLLQRGVIDTFENGSWSHGTTSMDDLTDLVLNPVTKEIYTSSFGYGVERHDAQGGREILDESNSPLINSDPPSRSVYITALANSAEGIWIANYGADKPLHLLNDGNNWQSFSLSGLNSRFPLHLVVDLSGSVWMAMDPAEGGGIIVFNPLNNEMRHLRNSDGQGGLPGNEVLSMSLDRNGMMWVGTDLGVGYFIDPGGIFSSQSDAIRPIVDGRFLLRDDKVTAIAVDGGNRKWFGTERGVWLYNPDGDVAIENFTVENSPLPANAIRDININNKTGEVFFATSQGLASFRGGSTEGNIQGEAVKVFPNPVTAEFTGLVGISGTPTDAVIKITDIAGKLVWQTKSNGGTATWNVQDNKGRRVGTGIYIVFIVTEDGKERMASKIAVVE